MERPISVVAVADWTPAELAMPCPDYPVYQDGDLGAFPDAKGTTFRIWAPTANGITLRLFDSGAPYDTVEPFQSREMTPAQPAPGRSTATASATARTTTISSVSRTAPSIARRILGPARPV